MFCVDKWRKAEEALYARATYSRTILVFKEKFFFGGRVRGEKGGLVHVADGQALFGNHDLMFLVCIYSGIRKGHARASQATYSHTHTRSNRPHDDE